MAKQKDPQTVTVAGKPLACLVCGGSDFFQRDVAMNTKGMTFFDLDWLNKSADGAVCASCGFVHSFLGDHTSWA